jgi:hypothetical protein
MIGTFWLVFGGCGSAVLAAAFLTWVLALIASGKPNFVHGGSPRAGMMRRVAIQ